MASKIESLYLGKLLCFEVPVNLQEEFSVHGVGVAAFQFLGTEGQEFHYVIIWKSVSFSGEWKPHVLVTSFPSLSTGQPGRDQESVKGTPLLHCI